MSLRCDVCGKLFNSRHLQSHKRLAHRNERSGIEKILRLFKNLSPESKKKVLQEMSAMDAKQNERAADPTRD